MTLVAISGTGFPASSDQFNADWDENWRLSEVALAAFLSGRHPRDRFEFGPFSVVDMLQKVLLVWVNLRVRGNRFVRSGLYEATDRSEKVGVSYSIGQALTHLFLTTTLEVPFTLHVDRYADEYAVEWAARSRRRPDLIGLGRGWVVAEAKGRAWGPSAQTLRGAAQQKNAIAMIAGERPRLRLSAISHFRNGTLALDISDPEEVEPVMSLRGSRLEFLRAYYDPILQLTRGGRNGRIFGTRARFAEIPGLDISLGIAEGIASSLRSEERVRLLLDSIASEGRDLRRSDEMRAITSSGVAILLE